jgi:hypothetical protein
VSRDRRWLARNFRGRPWRLFVLLVATFLALDVVIALVTDESLRTAIAHGATGLVLFSLLGALTQARWQGSSRRSSADASGKCRLERAGIPLPRRALNRTVRGREAPITALSTPGIVTDRRA